MNIVLVAAIAENNVIGRDGQMPWHLRSDLKHFRALTLHKPVIMGRKTYESIGKPLPDRTNIVLTRDLALSVPGGVLATSMDAALGYARDDARLRGIDDIMVIGGSGVFSAAMPLAQRLEITHVHARPEGDTLFPPIDTREWRESNRHYYEAGPHDSASFTVATYLRQ
jgi:dihydrofolate reductase